jgi:hypothetical protein
MTACLLFPFPCVTRSFAYSLSLLSLFLTFYDEINEGGGGGGGGEKKSDDDDDECSKKKK